MLFVAAILFSITILLFVGWRYRSRSSDVVSDDQPSYLAAPALKEVAEPWEFELFRWLRDNGTGVPSDLTPENLSAQTALYSMVFARSDSPAAPIHLPPEIGELTRLEALSFTFNGLSTLPQTIGNLCNLRELHLIGNRLEYLPDEICLLKNLTVISLVNNRLRTLPDDIGNLENLRGLWLAGNQLSELPRSVTQLTHLEYLDLDANPELDLSREQMDWVMSLVRKGAEVTLDGRLEAKMGSWYRLLKLVRWFARR